MVTMKNRFGWSAAMIGLALMMVLAACGQPTAAEPPTPAPLTDTPLPPATATPIPTPTPFPTATPLPDPTFPMHTAYFSYGIDVHLYYMDYEHVMGYVDKLGAEWIRQQVSWRDIESSKGQYIWDELDNVVAVVGQHNRKLLVSIVRSPAWATVDGSYGMPADPTDLGDFLTAMATRYQGKIQAYEIWNEQNYAVENDGLVEGAGRYVELLKVAYTAIKQVDPYAMVLFGPLTPTGTNNPAVAIPDVDYLQAAYEYNDGEVRNYFDVLAAHSSGTHNPPDTLWPDNPGPYDQWLDDPTFYFRHVEQVRAVMEAYGDGDKQMWVTEFGWASTEGITDQPAEGYEYAQNNTAQNQADYLVQALEMGRTNYQPWMGAMFVWNLNFAPITTPNDEKAAFGLLDPSWEARLSFMAVKKYISQQTEWRP